MPVLLLYTRNTNISRNIIKHNIRTSMNERKHFLIKKYNLSLVILERVMLVVCERWVGDRDWLLYWPKFFLTHSSTSSSSYLGLLNRGSLRVQSPQSAAGSHFGIFSPTNLNRPGHLVILLYHVHLLPLFFCLFTQVHLLIEGSVESQYITLLAWLDCQFVKNKKKLGGLWAQVYEYSLWSLWSTAYWTHNSVIIGWRHKLTKDYFMTPQPYCFLYDVILTYKHYDAII